jgi:putative FmdB family regulatory protein
MPLYEYKCLACGSSFEVLQKVSEPRLKKCPKCGGLLKKVLSAPSIQFKGSGWYITDYAQNKKPEKESKDKEKPKSEKKDSSKKKKSPSPSSSD